ncbi:hypothetical protein [Sphingomonas sp.]|jgi:hypothetical protein|uniref:hypothetical protein n=1 Tax=Sphingomonas sp. TaxID=28214 RepID=UPI002E143344|nr:hypothetical protein [Sphingomonas sp.]
MQRLRGYGLRLDSQLAIPGAVTDPDPSTASPDVVILCSASEAGSGERGFRLTTTGLVFSCFGVARFAIRSDLVEVTPEPGVALETVSIMLVATALPALLWLRGGLVLHAAAARMPGADAAIAITGRSGSGKSTILAQLAGLGADVVGDDSITFAPQQAGAIASGLPGGWFAVGADCERQFIPVAANRSLNSAPIGAIFVLDGFTEGGHAVERFDPVAATATLLVHRHRSRVPMLLGQAERVLRDVTLLAATIPIYKWRRGSGQTALVAAERAMLEQAGTE